MNCVLRTFERNLLQLKQRNFVQIAAVSKVPYDLDNILQKRLIVTRLKELKRSECLRRKEKKMKEERKRKQVCQAPNEFKLNWNPLLTNKANVLNFFKSEGLKLPVEDVDKHDNQLNAFSYRRLVAFLCYLKKMNLKFDQLDMTKISNFIMYRRIYPKSKTVLHGEFYEYLRKHRIDKAFKDMIVVHEKDVTKNLKYLDLFGFGFEEIASCPAVVCHSPEVLRVHLHRLLRQEEVESFEKLAKDKKKVINLIQFNIEKNNRFIAQVIKL